jgi:hypothetical protein
VSLKFRAFWNVAPRSQVEDGWHLRGAYCLHKHRPDSGSSTHLWNVGQLQLDYTYISQKTLNLFKFVYSWKNIRVKSCIVPYWRAQGLHSHQKFTRPSFLNGWKHGIKDYCIEGMMIFTMNCIKI